MGGAVTVSVDGVPAAVGVTGVGLSPAVTSDDGPVTVAVRAIPGGTPAVRRAVTVAVVVTGVVPRVTVLLVGVISNL